MLEKVNDRLLLLEANHARMTRGEMLLPAEVTP
jgi:hypothetical protein